MAGPADGVGHGLDEEVGFQVEAFPVCARWKREADEADLMGRGLSGGKIGAGEGDPAGVEQGNAQGSGDAADPFIGEAHDHPIRFGFPNRPHPRGANAIPDHAVQPINPTGILAVIVHHMVGMDVVPVPQRPIVRADVFDVGDNVFGAGKAVFETEGFGGAVGHADFGNESDVRRAVSGEFDLLRFDEDGV